MQIINHLANIVLLYGFVILLTQTNNCSYVWFRCLHWTVSMGFYDGRASIPLTQICVYCSNIDEKNIKKFCWWWSDVYHLGVNSYFCHRPFSLIDGAALRQLILTVYMWVKSNQMFFLSRAAHDVFIILGNLIWVSSSL